MMRSNPVKQKLAAGGTAYCTMIFELLSWPKNSL